METKSVFACLLRLLRPGSKIAVLAKLILAMFAVDKPREFASRLPPHHCGPRLGAPLLPDELQHACYHFRRRCGGLCGRRERN